MWGWRKSCGFVLRRVNLGLFLASRLWLRHRLSVSWSLSRSLAFSSLDICNPPSFHCPFLLLLISSVCRYLFEFCFLLFVDALFCFFTIMLYAYSCCLDLLFDVFLAIFAGKVFFFFFFFPPSLPPSCPVTAPPCRIERVENPRENSKETIEMQ